MYGEIRKQSKVSVNDIMKTLKNIRNESYEPVMMIIHEKDDKHLGEGFSWNNVAPVDLIGRLTTIAGIPVTLSYLDIHEGVITYIQVKKR